MNTIIARRQTADAKPVLVWEDGDLTQRLGYYFPGARVRKDRALSFMIAEEACLFAASEMGALIRAANTLAKKGPVLPGDLRALAHRLTKAARPRS